MAETFYVNQRGGSDLNPCTKVLECETIKRAIARAEEFTGPNRIEVNPEGEPEREPLTLNKAADKGLTINGTEKGVEVVVKTAAAITLEAAAGGVTLSNLAVNETGSHPVIVDHGAELTLDNVSVDNESLSATNGIEASKGGAVAINGGEVVMAEGGSGQAISAIETPLALSGTTVKTEGLSEAAGIASGGSGLSIANSKLIIENPSNLAKEEHYALKAVKDGTVNLANVTVVEESENTSAVRLESSPATVNALHVEMKSTGNGTGIYSAAPGTSPSSTFEHVEVGGTWAGNPMVAVNGNVTVTDSRLIAGPAGPLGAAALAYGEEVGAGPGLVVRRSVLSGTANSARGALFVRNGNATVDSSEILGGSAGILFSNGSGGPLSLTVAASTIDGGPPGLAGDAFPTYGVDATAVEKAGSADSVALEGSILLEPQGATVAGGTSVGVSCAYTAAPSQSQAAKGTEGSVACAAGANGNTESNPFSSLFAEPLSSYQLLPGSSAIDSVPAGAIVMPFGLTPSATDLAGSPRILDGNGDCLAVQDKGAFELQGHAAPCPPAPVAKPPAPKPLAGVISALTISPSAFAAAPSGATVARAKRRYGAKVSWRDTQAATTTFTVLTPAPGRLQGHACKKPSRANRHGHRCTLYRSLGTFTHTDVAGSNSLHFSGRLHGHRLAKGGYRLQAIARDAAGPGPAASKSFTIK